MGIIKGLFSLFKPNVSKDISEIDRMNGYEFEQYTGILLKKIGYKNITITQKSGDYGIDVICTKDGLKYAIQCKCYSNKLGNSPVQEAVAGKQYYKCDVGVVLTNNYFTENAINLAKANGILLWDRTELIKMLQKAKKSRQEEEQQFIQYDNSNLPTSPYTGLPNSIEINGTTYNIEDINEIEALPQFSTPFSCNGEEFYINTFFRRCAAGYKAHGMLDIAEALCNKAEQFESNSPFLSQKKFDFEVQSIMNGTDTPSDYKVERETENESIEDILDRVDAILEKSQKARTDSFEVTKITNTPYKCPDINIFEYADPNEYKATIRIYDLLDTFEFMSNKSYLCLGIDTEEKPVYCDIFKSPHILISGTTGSGKSICMQSIIVSMLCKFAPDELKLLLIDPKQIELKRYEDIPHLIVPVVFDTKKAVYALDWAVSEMLQRYQKLSQVSVRDIESYNRKAENHIPHICIFVDGLEILMLEYKNDILDSICKLAQMGRAVGMHLIIATQYEKAIQKANISTTIKANILNTSNRTCDEQYLLHYQTSNPKHDITVNGCFVTDEEIYNLCDCIKNQGLNHYSEDISKKIEEKIVQSPFENNNNIDQLDPLFEKAVDIVLENGTASTSFLQRKLTVGYARGANLIDQLEEKGIISPANGAKPREILITKRQWLEMQAYGEYANSTFN